MSQRHSGYERKERDLYETPKWVTEALIPHVHGVTLAWEPACGSGKMARVLAKHIAVVEVSDIEVRESMAAVSLGSEDFLCANLRGEFPLAKRAIITNPPYDLGTEFCEHALRLMEPVGGMVAMLMRTDFDHAKTRSHLFRDCPAFAKKVVLTKRIVWFEPEPGAKGKSPSFNHAWFVWDWKHEGPPTIGYGP